tara:strand:+ start:2211 stop:2789 length:579 start_codon:yes stop_codon:yes gene_type:complete
MFSEFSKHKNRKDGLRSQCRVCCSEYYKQYYEANKEKKKQYREVNKEKIAERTKQYREANKEKIAERTKQYREANKEKCAEISKRYFANMPAATYEIKNIKNGKVYIGCSTAHPRRWRQHKLHLRKGTHGNKRLQEDYNTFGLEAFEFSVVEEFPSDTPYKLLEAKETQLILEKQQKDVDLYNINVRMSLLV